MKKQQQLERVVIIGGGFGGLYAAQALKNAPVNVTLIDQTNFHLFQPLLYQVATGGLSPGDIASPLRAVLSRQKNVTVLKAKVTDIDLEQKQVILNDGQIGYDTVVVATGVKTSYFGNDGWAQDAPGLKSIDDALEIRRRIFLAYEAAEREDDPAMRQAWMTFLIVGGGPTGVELSGAIGELASTTLKHDFRQINPIETKVLLLEGSDRILPPYTPTSSARAEKALRKKGVTVQTGTFVTNIEGDCVTIKQGEAVSELRAKTIIWAAGMQATAMAQTLQERAGVALDRAGRVKVEPDMSIAGHPDVFVIGDLAHYAHQYEGGKPLPGVAPVAMQQGSYVAKHIKRKLDGQPSEPFHYFDKGNLAVIGRNAAVAEIGPVKLQGFIAWLIWIFVHIVFLVEFDNRILVMFQWGVDYFTRKRGARLIVGRDPYPMVSK